MQPNPIKLLKIVCLDLQITLSQTAHERRSAMLDAHGDT